jgi:hypothetical protein
MSSSRIVFGHKLQDLHAVTVVRASAYVSQPVAVCLGDLLRWPLFVFVAIIGDRSEKLDADTAMIGSGSSTLLARFLCICVILQLFNIKDFRFCEGRVNVMQVNLHTVAVLQSTTSTCQSSTLFLFTQKTSQNIHEKRRHPGANVTRTLSIID